MTVAPYATREDLEAAISAGTVAALFNNVQTNAVDTAALLKVLTRASARVDGWLATVFLGPFPVEQTPVPAIIVDAALEFAIAFSFMRHPEYVQTYGEEYRAQTRLASANEMMERITSGEIRLPDWVLQPKGQNVGGYVVDGGHRIISTDPDGTENSGDF